MSTGILDELKSFYESHDIYAFNFNCKHYADCSRGCEKFTQARSAFVGREYERTFPRILFLSLDPGEGESIPSPEDRTLEGVRALEETNCNVSQRRGREKTRHWYRTHELAGIILQEFKINVNIGDTHNYFAHTNSAKCCMNKNRSSKADPRLFENCREYIPGEIGVLQPDIIVSQGLEAEAAVRNSIPPLRIVRWAGTEPCLYAVLDGPWKKAVWLHTYHPRAWGKFNNQRRHFESWSRQVHDELGLGRGFAQ